MRKVPKIVCIGGGTGTFVVLSGLKKYRVSLSAIVTMADNGGSTGILRDELGVLPAGDVRQCLVALSNEDVSVRSLFTYRFGPGALMGHNFGNIFMAALEKTTGSFEKAIEEAGRILNIQGRVIPSTLESCHLSAKLENGQIIKGETNIDVPKHNGDLKIEKVWLDPGCDANPKALDAIKEAHLVIIGPGDLYSSILPNFLVKGMVEAVQESKAKKVFVCNLMTKFGETNNFTASDSVEVVEEYLGKGVLTHIVVNTKKPSPERVQKYEKEHAEFVQYDKKELKEKKLKVIEEDFLKPAGLVRHNLDTLARILCKL